MNFGGGIKKILDQPIKFDLEAKVTPKIALVTTTCFILMLGLLGSFISSKITNFNNQDVFSKKVELLQEASEATGALETKSELALAYYLKGEPEQAGKIFLEILQQDSNNTTANIYYGLILTDQQKYPQAISFLEKGVKNDPNREKLAYLYLGQSYYHTGQLGKALTNLEISSKVNPQSPLNYYYLGLIYKQQQNYPKARAAWNRALGLTGGNYPEVTRELKGLPTKK